MAAKKRVKKTWNVTVPISGRVFVTVEAADEESAIEAALEAVGDVDQRNVEWEAHRRIVSGNCFHGMQNEIDVEEER